MRKKSLTKENNSKNLCIGGFKKRVMHKMFAQVIKHKPTQHKLNYAKQIQTTILQAFY